MPDDVAVEQPKFSGFVRYECTVQGVAGQKTVLEITDAEEAVEVYVNQKSLGIQIAPPFRYDLSGVLEAGENRLVIEVATTLERQAYPLLKGFRKMLASPPSGKTGLSGTVRLYRK